MALHTKTVEYAFTGSVGPQTGGSQLTFSTLTVTIPETSSRTFKSVILVIMYKGSITALTSNTTAPTASLQLGAASASNYTVGIDTSGGATYLDMGTEQHWIDVTTNFTTNFGGGTTQTAVLKFQCPVATGNICAKLIITYECDDTNDTRCKTVRIPLEGGTGALTGSLTQVGGSAEIPNLSTFLPESSVTVTDIFFEVNIALRNPNANSTTSLALDSESAFTLDIVHSGGSSSSDQGVERWLWKRTDMTTNATHAFKASCNQTNANYDISVVLHVTYTYTHSTSTTILNSVMIPFDILSWGEQDITSVTKLIAYPCEFWIEEPGSITMVQSAIQVRCGYQIESNAGDALELKAGAQAGYTAYASPDTAGFVKTWAAGTHVTLQLRCDPSATGGAAFTIARGKNSTYFQLYANGTFNSTYNVISCTYAVLYLNYTSGKHTNGDGVHNKTVFWAGFNDVYNVGATNDVSVTGFALSESTSWWNNGFVPLYKTTQHDGFNFTFQYQGGELLGNGWGTAAAWVNPNFTTFHDPGYGANRKQWDRFYNDPDTTRANPLVTRTWRTVGSVPGGSSTALMFYMTYHSIVYTIQGIVRGYTGAGSGITVNAHRSDTGELIATTTTASGGSFSMSWYDNTIPVYTEAYQDATHLGRSANATAV